MADEKKMSFEEFVKVELNQWVRDNEDGKELPSVVQRLLQGAYRNYANGKNCEECGVFYVPVAKEKKCGMCTWKME